MNAVELCLFWQENFPECPPVSYLFRHNLADRWFRFHSLPQSKRYAEDDSEIAQVLKRQNAVLLDVIGDDDDCLLVTGDYSDPPLKENFEDCPALADFEFQKFIRLSKQDFDPEELTADDKALYLNLLFTAHKLKPHSLDKILICIEGWKIGYTFVVNPATKRIFAPYDGGVDVILRDSNERDRFKLKYKNWLSSYSGGL